jgi:hypothetical protein
MLAIRTARFEDLLLGVETALAKTISVRSGDSTTDKPNPEYDACLVIWSTLASMFSLHTHLGSVNMRITPATTTKGASTLAESK